MNKILTLYDIEIKRIYKLYFSLLGVLGLLNIGVVIFNLAIIVNDVGSSSNSKATLDLLKTNSAKNMIFEHGASTIYYFTTLLLGLSVLLCLIYALVIWYRDFLGKCKTGYTLFMLPNNKFNIYISKAITIITMIYGVMVTQIVFWILELGIIKILTNMNNNELSNLVNILFDGGAGLPLIQTHFMDFLMIDVIGVILAVIVIFTGVMIHKSVKIVGVVIGGVYILGSITIYVYMSAITNYSDQLLMIHSIYYLVMFIVSIGLSYILLNKKVYI